ncbi:MAG: 16S rRNA (uracil(1498)-N(3))-methyltransferase [Desulfobulbaceae bacterium]|nr:16S rRNA (uracil(1498)-N(3))-methyltransferase [Desulfobulbaceae bacterium]
MNLLLLEQEELQGDRLVLNDHRATHLRQVLRVEPGSVVRLGIIGGRQGRGEVLQVSECEVSLRVELAGETATPPQVELILALPRPIMLQRIFKQATVMGVRRIHLIRSQRVEKSFFASPVLSQEKSRALILEGMEQAVDTWMPGVHIHQRFKPFVEDVVPQLPGRGFIAHPHATGTLDEVFIPPSADCPLLLAVGPEGGWNDYELNAFTNCGFAAFSMGKRILHVDTAVVALMAQIDLLCQLREKR